MAEHLRYGFTPGNHDDRRLSIGVPASVWQAIGRDPELLSSTASLYKDSGVIEVRNAPEAPEVLFNVGRISQGDRTPALLGQTAKFINGLEKIASDFEAGDPRLLVRLDTEPSGDKQALRPWIEVALPDIPDRQLAEVAQDTMRRIGKRLKYSERKVLKAAVKASVRSAEKEIALIPNKPAGRELIRSPFILSSGRILLNESTLRHRKEQFMCFAGAVALVNSEELVAKE